LRPLIGHEPAILPKTIHEPIIRPVEAAVEKNVARPASARCRGHDEYDSFAGQPEIYPKLPVVALMQVSAAGGATGDDGFTDAVSLPILRPVGGAQSQQGISAMDKDRIKGTVKKAKGTIKEGVGKASGDTALEFEGKVDKAEGSVQKAFGTAKDALRKG
jgi:uncharacterized protein YjbJ (UPF0337 family)